MHSLSHVPLPIQQRREDFIYVTDEHNVKGISIDSAFCVRRTTRQSFQRCAKAFFIVGRYFLLAVTLGHEHRVVVASESGNGEQKTHKFWFGTFGSDEFDLRIFSAQ